MAKYNVGSIYKTANPYYGFTKDCIICFDDVKTYMNENFFSSYEPEEVGRITDENVLNQILEKINKSPKI